MSLLISFICMAISVIASCSCFLFYKQVYEKGFREGHNVGYDEAHRKLEIEIEINSNDKKDDYVII